ncbi:hypothetical protein GCM10009551_054280 [Nocardiopsis tropica]
MTTEIIHTDLVTGDHFVCDTCTPALAAGDLTAFDAIELPGIEDRIAEIGPVVDAGPVDPGGYWECSVCEEVTIGAGRAFASTG